MTALPLAGTSRSDGLAGEPTGDRPGADSSPNHDPGVGAPGSLGPHRRPHRWGVLMLVGLPLLIVLGVVVAWLFAVEVVVVPTTSMLPAIHPGDLVLVDKVAYATHGPRLGDVVVFENPEFKAIPAHSGNALISAWRHQFAPVDRVLIKRVIGLPGQVVQVTPDAVLIDGRVLREPWLRSPAQGKTFGPYRIPKGEYFLMGDNRLHSIDSRYFPGHAVPRSLILGKAISVLWPPSQVHRLG